MATAFGWKKKTAQNVSRKRARAFDESEQRDDSSFNEAFELDWRVLVKRSAIFLEDNVTKGKRLKSEGAALAEQERYWEAIGKWDEAMCLLPKDETLYEMKAQALLELNEVFPAIQAAQIAVELNPLWPAAYQTLGRTQLGFGEVEMALHNFCKAAHLRPDDKELWKEDLLWAQKLRAEERQREATEAVHNKKEELHIDLEYY